MTSKDFDLRYISLGAGVQSSTLALMASRGLFEPVAGAIFADTGAEPAGVYRWLDWLERQLTFPVYRVSAGDLALDGLEVRTSKRSGNRYVKHKIPLYVQHDVGPARMTWRQCTRDYKVTPIIRKLAELTGSVPTEQWLGISTDEAHRMKASTRPWITNRYPLIEAGISRQGCIDWMAANGYPRPPRSACIFCPYHSDREWLRLKQEEPDEFFKAVEYEKQIQAAEASAGQLHGTPFLHRSCKPLAYVEFDPHKNQLDLFGNECEGMCGV